MKLFPDHFILFLLVEVVIGFLLIRQYRDYKIREKYNVACRKILYWSLLITVFVLYIAYSFLQHISS